MGEWALGAQLKVPATALNHQESPASKRLSNGLDQITIVFSGVLLFERLVFYIIFH